MTRVVSTGEARESLHQIARGFDAGEGEPVYFGSHRRAQAVIVPVAVWERLLEQAEDDVDRQTAAERLSDEDGRRLSRDDVNEILEHLAGPEA
jgi:PHD/YefM family antitoxin component YafN of YafNO toxin-antitoxin module